MSRVTVVLNDLPGRSETFMATFVSALADAGHQVTLVPLRPSPSAASAPTTVPVVPGLPPARSWRAPAALLRLRRQLATTLPRSLEDEGWRAGGAGRAVRVAASAAAIRATEPDVVHFGFSGIAVAFEPVLDQLTGCALVTSCRGTAELVEPLLDTGRQEALGRVLRRMDVVHAVSDHMAAAVTRLGAAPDRVRVVRPAIDLDRFPARPAPSPVDGEVRVVTVGRLVGGKAVEDLVSAVAVAARRGLVARLRVIGDGPTRMEVVRRSHLLGVADRVDVLGHQAPAAVADELAAADVWASASLSEGISNAMLEAMAVGRPPTATAVGGTGEVVIDGVDGLLVPAGDPAAMAEAWCRLAADPAERERMGTAARARVADGFGLGRLRAEWADLYAAVAATMGEVR